MKEVEGEVQEHVVPPPFPKFYPHSIILLNIILFYLYYHSYSIIIIIMLLSYNYYYLNLVCSIKLKKKPWQLIIVDYACVLIIY